MSKTWDIKKGTDIVLKAHELEYHDEWMGEDYLTVTVNSDRPVDFSVGDYIDYRGERFVIEYDPTVLKKARQKIPGKGFVYDSIKFVNEAQAKIVRCDFNDIVLGDNNQHYSALPTFPFYCETVDDLLDRVLANLEELYPGEFTIIGLNTDRNRQRGEITHNDDYIEEYKLWIDPAGTPNRSKYGNTGIALTADNINCWSALSWIHDEFGLNFIMRGYTIVVGTAGTFTANTFRYGKGKGLHEIERICEQDQQIVTRARAYGSETNLPSRYYAELNKQVFATVTEVTKYQTSVGAYFTIDLPYNTKYFTSRSVSYPGNETNPNFVVKVTANNHTVRGFVAVVVENPNVSRIFVQAAGTQFNDTEETDTQALQGFINDLTVGDRVYFTAYVEKSAFDASHTTTSTENLPDNMAVNRLMLPGFPNQSLYDWAVSHGWTVEDAEAGKASKNGLTLAFSKDKYRPYIDSPNVEEYGVRPASIMFDGTGDNEDIHPTIEGMTYQGHPVDEIALSDVITDNGVYAAGEEVPYFTITLPALGFELDEYWKDGETISIDMKNGMCGARSFEIKQKPTKTADGKWVCTCARVHDETLDLWYPYRDFLINPGDKYVLIGIDMSDAYVTAASERLFDATIGALLKKHAPRYTYQPRIDELFMQRQHDESLEHPEIRSLHDTLKAGDIFCFEDLDLGIDANVVIDILTIKENGNNGIPTYELTLRDEKQVGFMQKVQQRIDTLFSGGFNGNGGGGGGLTPRQTQTLIENEGGDRFLSKQTDDTAKGRIGFLKGFWIKAKGLFGWDSNGDITANNVNATGSVVASGGVITGDVRSTNYSGDTVSDSGFWMGTTAAGRTKLVIDEIYVRMKAVFEALEVKKWSVVAGDEIRTCAANTITRVDYFSCGYDPESGLPPEIADPENNPYLLGYSKMSIPWLTHGIPLLLSKAIDYIAGTMYHKIFARKKWMRVRMTFDVHSEGGSILAIRTCRCYFLAKDGEREVENWWKGGNDADGNDFARCQTMNLKNINRETYTELTQKQGNVFWWRKVVNVSRNPVTLDDGKQYHYFDVAFNYAEENSLDQSQIDWCWKGSDIPAAGDDVVQFGNDINPGRMNAVITQVNGGGRYDYNYIRTEDSGSSSSSSSEEPLIEASDAPCTKYLRGIYCFDLNKSWWGGTTCKCKLSPSTGYEFYGPDFKFIKEFGEAKVETWRGQWKDIALELDDYYTDNPSNLPDYSDDIKDGQGVFVSRAGGSAQNPIPKQYVRKCYYYDAVIHATVKDSDRSWLCSASDGMHWVAEEAFGNYRAGQYIPDASYAVLTTENKSKCARKPDYTSSEPAEGRTVWTMLVNMPPVYSLLPSVSEIIFAVDQQTGQFTPASQDLYCGYKKVDGNGEHLYPGNVKANLSNLPSKNGTATYNIFYRLIQADGTPYDGWHFCADINNGNPTTPVAGVGVGTLRIPSGTTFIAVEYALSYAVTEASVANANIIQTLRISVKHDGKPGANGEQGDAYELVVSKRTLVFDDDTQQYVGGNTFTVMKTLNGATETKGVVTISCNGQTVATVPNGASVTNPPVSAAAEQAAYGFDIVWTYNSQVVASSNVSVVKNGSRGRTGRMFYLAGTWDAQAEYVRNDDVCPIVEHNNNYWYLDVASSQNQEPGTQGTASVWKVAQNFGVVLTEALFTQYAKLGSFVVAGDFIISQYGTLLSNAQTLDINEFPPENWPSAQSPTNIATYRLFYQADGTDIDISETGGSGYKPAYMYFDSGDPMAENAPVSGSLKFRPALVLNALTGASYQTKAYISGTVRADNFYHPAALVFGNDDVSIPTFIFDAGGTKKWIYIYSLNTQTAQELAQSYGFDEGDYFDTDKIKPDDLGSFESCWNNTGFRENDFVFCTYNADIVTCMNLMNIPVSSPLVNRVYLPGSSKFPGKIVDVYNNDAEYDIYVSVVNANMATVKVDGNYNLIIDYNNMYSAWKIPPGKTVRFYSALVLYNGAYDYYWLVMGASQNQATN